MFDIVEDVLGEEDQELFRDQLYVDTNANAHIASTDDIESKHLSEFIASPLLDSDDDESDELGQVLTLYVIGRCDMCIRICINIQLIPE